MTPDELFGIEQAIDKEYSVSTVTARTLCRALRQAWKERDDSEHLRILCAAEVSMLVKERNARPDQKLVAKTLDSLESMMEQARDGWHHKGEYLVNKYGEKDEYASAEKILLLLKEFK